MTDNVKFIAEVSSNHHQELDRCLQFIDVAADIACDGVKFQLFKIDELFAPEVLAKSETHRKRREWELAVDYIPVLAERCKDRSISFSCTPFYLDAVDELKPYVDFYKIASYELLWTNLLIKCARTGKPVVISTGMATMDEVTKAVETLCLSGCKDLTLLHCVSGYPAPPDQCNLAAIQTLREAFALEPPTFDQEVQISIGWSDHSVQPGVVHRAIHRWKAEMIEFHLDLEGKGAEFGAGHCWLPDQIGAVIRDTTTAMQADGTGEKAPTPVETPDRDWRADPSDGLRPLRSLRDSF